MFVNDTADIDAYGGIIQLEFNAVNVRTGLTASSNKSWAVVQSVDEQNHVVVVNVSENTGGESRTGSTYGATIVLNGIGNNGAVVNTSCRIDQMPGSTDIYVQPDELYFDYNDTTGKNITLQVGSPWEITGIDEQ